MNRKMPALTSPWKVGFLVALLLVVTALGVSYFITGTFGITWHWIKFADLSPTSWVFNLGAFLDEMVPLLVLTALLAIAAYVLVAGAVRRYKAYIDSGSEYKQLLKSIKSIEDLEDEQLMGSLKEHPELREFMMSIKNRVAAFERKQGDRGRKPSDSASGANQRQAVVAEIGLLASALMNGPEGLSRELALTVPELKQIERIVKERFKASAKGAAPKADESAAVRGQLDRLRDAVRGAVTELRSDVTACASVAREVHSAVAGLRQMIESVLASAPAAETPAVGNSAAVLKRVDAVADALATLGEDTKRIAIASALQASDGSHAEAIHVADEVRTVATRFNAVAQHWRETAPALKKLLDAAATGAGRAADPRRTEVAAAVVAVSNKVSLWGERVVAMNEHVRELEQAIGVDAAEGMRAEASAPEATATPAAASPIGAATPADEGDDFITRSGRSVFETSAAAEDAPFADIPGFEKERQFFVEPSAAGANADKDDRFEVDGNNGERWDLSSKSESPAPEPAAHSDADGFLTGPRQTVSPKRTERRDAAAPADRETPAPEPAPRPAPAPALDTATATLDPDADAVDLYALGAIDCVQTA